MSGADRLRHATGCLRGCPNLGRYAVGASVQPVVYPGHGTNVPEGCDRGVILMDLISGSTIKYFISPEVTPRGVTPWVTMQ